jgi:hypothetical protein
VKHLKLSVSTIKFAIVATQPLKTREIQVSKIAMPKKMNSKNLIYLPSYPI